MRSRVLGLALFAGALVVLALVQDVSVVRSPASASESVAEERGTETPEIAAEQTEPAAEAVPSAPAVVPEVEGMAFGEALAALEDAGLSVLLFDGEHHAVHVEGFKPSSGDAYITATRPSAGEPSEDGQVVVAVSWDRKGLSDAARRDPWWWPGHMEGALDRSQAACADCHDERDCSGCHFGKANTYLPPGQTPLGFEEYTGLP